MTAWYILPPLKSLCLKCPIPGGCRESDPRCPWALARASKGPRRMSRREVQVLAYLEANPDTWFRMRDVIAALSAAIPKPTVSSVLLRLRREGRVEEVGSGHSLRLRAIEGPLT